MSGIQITGLFSGMNWSSIVTELIAADSGPINELKTQVTTNTAKINTFSSLGTDITSLETAVQGLGDFGTNVFNQRAAAMADSSSTWSPDATTGTPVGTYAINVSTLASSAQLNGGAGISSALSATSSVSGLTLSTLHTAVAPTAGAFTVNGQQVNVTLSESLQDVFNSISTATGGNVTASYNPSTDKVQLSTADGSNVVLGATNDTSNILSVLKLSNGGASSVTSSGALGSVSTTSPLASAGLKGSFGSVDSSGNGSFSVNGVSISYNVNTDSISSILSKITGSSAGVTAAYDPQVDRMTLTDNSTGDVGISANDTQGSLLAALGLGSTATLQRGTNATFSVNGGPSRTATTNALTSSDLGITGLALTVNSTGTQSISVTPDVSGMQTAIQGFITAYNTLQTDITSDTQITQNADGTVSTSVLSGNYEVEDWGSNLRNLVFNSIPGLSGTVSSLDNIGVGFTGTANQLSVTDSAKLTAALSSNPSDVAAFFQSGSNGLVSKLSTYLNATLSDETSLSGDLQTSNKDTNNQISLLQARLNQEQSQLTAAFTAMEDAVQTSQNQSQTLGSSFSLPSTNSTTAQTTANASSGSSSSSG